MITLPSNEKNLLSNVMNLRSNEMNPLRPPVVETLQPHFLGTSLHFKGTWTLLPNGVAQRI
jgi:hypothetical protein